MHNLSPSTAGSLHVGSTHMYPQLQSPCVDLMERSLQVIIKLSFIQQKSVERRDMSGFFALNYPERHHNNSFHVARQKREPLLWNFPNWRPNAVSLASGNTEKGTICYLISNSSGSVKHTSCSLSKSEGQDAILDVSLMLIVPLRWVQSSFSYNQDCIHDIEIKYLVFRSLQLYSKWSQSAKPAIIS